MGFPRLPRRCALLILVACLPAAHGQVVINEFKAANSDRLLQWSEDNVSRIGPGTAWYELGYDDGNWASGQAPLGYGVDGLNTPLDLRGTATSLYLRKAFTLSATDAARVGNLLLNMNFTDGVVVYLNGVEVVRKGLGAAGMRIYHDQFAYMPGDYDETLSLNLGPTNALLREGQNVLAVQVHDADSAYFQVAEAGDALALSLELFTWGLPPYYVFRTDTFRYFVGTGEPSGGFGDGVEFYDWIELHNQGGAPVPLQGWSLTDDASEPRKWAFPQVTIGAGAYLVVFASEEESPSLPLQTNFRLEADGEYLGLVDVTGAVVSSMDPAYPAQSHFYSYGLRGAAGYQYLDTPTPGAPNNQGGAYAALLPPPVFDHPNGLYESSFDLVLSAEEGADIYYTLTQRGRGGPQRWEFNTAGNTEGWAAWNSTGGMSTSDGALHFEMTGFDPFVGGPAIDMAAAENPYITIRLRSSEAGMFEFFWTRPDAGFQAPLSARFTLTVANEWRTYVVDLRNHTEWRDSITQLRLDPAGYPGTCDIDYIRVGPEPDDGPAEPGETETYVPGRVPTLGNGERYTGPITVAANTIVRARAFRAGDVPSDAASGHFLFTTGLPGDEAGPLRSLPVISVVADEERSLIEPFGFLSVVGGAYDDQHGWWRPITQDDYNNPVMHGRPYEGAVGAAFFDPNTNEGVGLDAGMRIGRSDVARPSFRWNGGHWRDSGKWTMRLDFDSEYGQRCLEYPLMPEAISENRFRSLALRTFGADPYNPFASEELTRRNQINMGAGGSYGTYVNLFINGQFKAYMNACDRLDENYFQTQYNSSNTWDVLKKQVNRWFEPTLELHDGSYDNWNALIAYIRSHDLANLEDYLVVAGWVDLPQFIDWMMANVYSANLDWPWNNWIAAREQAPRGKWRFYVWDADYTLQLIGDPNHPTLNNMEYQGNEVNDLYRALKRSSEFRLLFQDRVQKHCYNGGALTPEAVQATFDEIRASVEPMVRFMYNQDYNEWIPQNWIPYRTANIIQHFADLGYGPALNAPTYTQDDTQLVLANPNDRGAVYFTTDGADPRRSAGASSAVILPGDAPKRVLVPTSDTGDWWRSEIGFNDDAWREGTGAVGYEAATGYETYIGIDVQAEMQGLYNGCYVRIPFNLPADSLPGMDYLGLGVQYDDGFVAYLNGVEVARIFASDPVLWNSGATGNHEATAGFDEIDISPHLGLLQDGDNLLALHGLNAGVGSTDFIINARLTLAAGGGATPSASAAAYTDPLPGAHATPVMARVYDAATGDWSPLLELAPTADETNYEWLTITEIMYHPAPGGAEFIELWNAGQEPINLAGVYFSAGVEFTFPEGAILRAGEYLVLVALAESFAEAYPGIAIGGEYAGNLDNSGETVTLRDPDGNLLLRVQYGESTPWPPAADGQGFSLVPIDVFGDLEDPANWRASGPFGGTPGGPDVPAEIVPVLVNEALTHTDLPQRDSIELYNPALTPADVRGWFVTDDRMTPKKARIPFETGNVIPVSGYLVLDETFFKETPGTLDGEALPGFLLSSLGSEDVYLFSADSNGQLTGYSHGFSFGAAANGVSFGRHVTSTGEVHFVPQRTVTLGSSNAGPKVGPVVLSAIHYHPLEEGGVEYLELTNISDAAVSLWDTAPAGVPENTYTISGINFAFPMNTVLPAHGTALVADADPAAFRQNHFVPGGVRVYGPFGTDPAGDPAGLSNSGEAVTLRWPDEPTPENDVGWIVMDRVRYEDSDPWPGADGDGMVLLRRDTGAYGNDPANWETAANPYPAGDRAHSADLDGNRVIDTLELLRVVQHYGAGRLACEASLEPTEDRYVPGAEEPQGCTAHSSDYAPEDWHIGLGEVLRLVQFHNGGGYTYCPEAQTEDGFCVPAP